MILEQRPRAQDQHGNNRTYHFCSSTVPGLRSARVEQKQSHTATALPPPWPLRAWDLPRDALSLVAQVEIIIDTEVSLQLLPCIASRFVRMSRQRRLQGMWRQMRLQKQRWIQPVEACKTSKREGRLRQADCD